MPLCIGKDLCTCAALHVAGVVPLFELSLSVRCHNRCHGGCTRSSPPVQLPVSVPEPRQTGSAAQWISCSVGERAPHRYLRLHQTSKQAAVKTQERRILGTRTLPRESPGLVRASDESGSAVGVPLVDSQQQSLQIACQSNRKRL